MICTHFNHREVQIQGWVITVDLYGSTIHSWKVGSKDQFTIKTGDDVESISVEGEQKLTDDDLTENMTIEVEPHGYHICTKCGYREALTS